jgi:hypothetical protein
VVFDFNGASRDNLRFADRSFINKKVFRVTGKPGENPARSRHCEKDEAERMNDEYHSSRSPKFFKSGYLARSLASGMFRGKTSTADTVNFSQGALFTDSMDQRTRRFSVD